MPSFDINQHRHDPYKNFKFSLQMKKGSKFVPVSGLSKISPLKRTTEVVTHREGDSPSTPRHSPGQSRFEPITLERGVTHDHEFEAWATSVYSTGGDGAVSLKNYKRDLLLEFRNLQGVVVRSYTIRNCWVSEYTALPELDANANGVAFESIVVQNEGWYRDLSETEKLET